jgi:hypothetical protein
MDDTCEKEQVVRVEFSSGLKTSRAPWQRRISMLERQFLAFDVGRTRLAT